MGGLQCALNIHVLHAFRHCQPILIGHHRGINLPGLERINSGLQLHPPIRHLVQLGFLAPPFFIGHKRNGAAVVIKLVHLIWARTPLRVRILQIALVERLGVRHRRVQRHRKQGLPPRVRLLKRHHHLLIGLAGGHTLNQVVTIRGINAHIRVLPITHLPRVLKHVPVESRAIIKYRIRVQVIGDHGFPVDLFGAHIGQIRRIRVWRPVAVGEHQLRVIPVPQGVRIHHRIAVRRIRLLRHLTNRQRQLATILDLVTLQRVIVAGKLNFHATRRIRRRLLLRRLGTPSQHQRRRRHHSYYSRAIPFPHHDNSLNSIHR